jgi:tetratricopeptide (TPR) repeat protein
VLTLVDHAAPSRLREAYLQLRAHDPATELIVDVQQLAKLPSGTTVILAVTPSISADALDWLNLNRPVVADRRLNIVLWCEDDAAATVARGAPDFFDWISARVDCPPAPAAFAVADVKAAIRERAPGIAWAGPGLEETLAAVRPGRPIRRVAVDSYQSMVDALTSREPGWLFLAGIDSEFHLRRLRWAMAETGRRVIVFRRAIAPSLPGWWAVHAEHAPLTDAIHDVHAAGGTGRLVALAALDPAAVIAAVFLLRHGCESAGLEELLATTADPRALLLECAHLQGWTLTHVAAASAIPWISAAVYRVFESESARQQDDDDPVVSALRKPPLGPERWIEVGRSAVDAGDPELAIRWLTTALQGLPHDATPLRRAFALLQRGLAHVRAEDLTSARRDLEQAFASARGTDDVWLIALSAAALGRIFLDQGEPQRAREYLESTLNAATKLDDENTAVLLNTLAQALIAQNDLAGARALLERVLAIKRRILATDQHSSIAHSLARLGSVLAAQGDMKDARALLERALEIDESMVGVDNPLLVGTLRELAYVRWKTGDLAGARAHLERALAIQRLAFRSDHPDTAHTLTRLAAVLADTGDLDGAQAVLGEALAIQCRVFGDDGQFAGVTTRRQLAKVLAAKGDLTGAIENLQRALATQRRIFERGDQPDIAATQRELERLQALQRDLQRPD